MDCLKRHFRQMVDAMRTSRPRRDPAGQNADWLPPVFGPQDWYIGVLADRDAAWYFERDQS